MIGYQFLYFTKNSVFKIQINKLRVKHNSSIAISDVKNIDQLNECMQQEKFNYVIFSPEHASDSKMEFSDIEKITNCCKQHNSISVATKIDTGEYLAMAASAGVDYILGNFVYPPMENIVSTETVEV